MGTRHGCGLRASDGRIVCWGGNDWGQTDAPDGVFASLFGGSAALHTCGLLSVNGSSVCWGANWVGQLDFSDIGFASLSVGDGYTCGLRSDDGGAVYWGSNSDGRLDIPQCSVVRSNMQVFPATCVCLDGYSGDIVWSNAVPGVSTNGVCNLVGWSAQTLALVQVAVDNGDWRTAALLVPVADPRARPTRATRTGAVARPTRPTALQRGVAAGDGGAAPLPEPWCESPQTTCGNPARQW